MMHSSWGSGSRFVTVAVALALSAICVPAGLAYSCTGLAYCEVPRAGDVIFTGEVLRQGAKAISDDQPARPNVFRVLQVFHGLEPGTTEVELWSPNYENLLPGSRWVIDAVRATDGGRMNDRHCGRSARLDDPAPALREAAEAFLKQLEGRRDGTAPTTVIVHAYASPLSRFGRVGSVDFVLRNSQGTVQFSLPDDDLFFEREIEPGEYDVEVAGAILPFLGVRQGKFKVQAGSCNTLGLEFGRRTRLSGTVTLTDGSPAAGVNVTIQPFLPGGKPDDTTLTDATGRYEFRGMFAGEYTVFATHHGFRNTFFGGSTSSSSARPIAIKEPGEISCIDIQLADQLPLAEVTLLVTTVDGAPAGSAPINLSIREFFEGDETSSFHFGETDYKGQFTITSKVGAFVEVRANVGPAVAISSSSTKPLETGQSSFRVVEAAQSEQLPLLERLCRVSLLKWEPCAEEEVSR